MSTVFHNLWAAAAPRRSMRCFLLLFVLAALFALPLRAADDDDNKNSTPTPASQPAAQPPSGTSSATPTNLWNQPYMFNWGGERDRLAQQGLTFTFFWITDDFGDLNVPKGTRQEFNGWYRLRGTVDVDFSKFTSMKGLTFHITGLWQGGQNMGGIIGSISNPSGLVSIHTLRLDSGWFQQSLFNDRLVLTGGQMAAEDFYGLCMLCGNFLMEPFDYNFGVMNDVHASWDPASGPGGQILVRPIPSLKNIYVKAGIFSGRNYSETGWNYSKKSAPTYDAEIGYHLNGKTSGGKTYPGDYEFGSYYNNGNEFTSATYPYGQTQGYYMIYAQASQAVYRVEEASNRGLDVVFGFERGQDNIIPVSTIAGTPADWEVKGGVSFNGPIPARPKDAVSFGFVHNHINSNYNNYLIANEENTLSNETAFEWNYRAQVTPWMVFQPVLQYYNNVGGTKNSVYLAGMRLQVFF